VRRLSTLERSGRRFDFVRVPSRVAALSGHGVGNRWVANLADSVEDVPLLVCREPRLYDRRMDWLAPGLVS
jgi:hypothetical protein